MNTYLIKTEYEPEQINYIFSDTKTKIALLEEDEIGFEELTEGLDLKTIK